MPTYEKTRRFMRDYKALSKGQKATFRKAVTKFVADLASHSFRKGLRVKRVQGTSDIFEMTWASDGRAVFRYGDEHRTGEPHVIWLRVGTHAVLDHPED